MARHDVCLRAIVLAVVLATSGRSACADMRVLDSNTLKHQRDQIIKGNTISNLGPCEWVRVLMLENHTTKFFGERPRHRGEPPIGTRGTVQCSD
jgi:hypothetical protein